MKFKIFNKFNSANGYTAVSIDRDAFRAVRRKNDEIQAASWKVKGDVVTRKFVFENAELLTQTNRKTGATRCFVKNEDIEANLADSNNELDIDLPERTDEDGE